MAATPSSKHPKVVELTERVAVLETALREREDDIRELVANLDAKTLGEVVHDAVANLNIGDQLTFTEYILIQAAASRLRDG